MVRLIAGLSIAIGTALVTAAMAAEPEQAAEQVVEQATVQSASDRPVPQDYVAHSVKDLQRLRRLKYMEPVSVDMEVSVTFVGPDWTTIFACEGADPIMITCTPAVSKELRHIPLGTRLHLRGYSNHGHEAVDLANFELLAGKPIHISSISSRRDDEGKLRANVFMTERGLVKEVFLRDKLFSLIIDCAHEKCQLERYSTVDLADAIRYFDSQVEFTGVFSPTFNELGSAQHKVRVMASSQLTTLPRADTAAECSLEQFNVSHGAVIFSDAKSHFALATGDDVLIFDSSFCEHIHPGAALRVYERKISKPTGSAPASEIRPGTNHRTASLIVLEGEHALEAGQKVRAGSLLRATTRPSRVTLDARVDSVQRIGKDLLLGLESDGLAVECMIPEYDFDQSHKLDINTRAADIARGDIVRVTGTVKKFAIGTAAQAPERTRAPLQMFCSSSRDLTIVSKARYLTFTQVASFLGGIFCVMGLSVAGNWYLKRSVDARTRQLTIVTRRLQATFESMREGLLVCENNGAVAGVNHRFVELFGFEPVAGEAIGRVLDRLENLIDDQSVIRELRASTETSSNLSLTRTMQIKDTARTIEVFRSAVHDNADNRTGELWAFQDITKKIEFEHEVVELKKIDAAGQLSAGVAHDFNNLLTVIRSNLFSLERTIGSNEKARPLFCSADMAIERAAVLTEYLLDYSRRSRLQLAITDVRKILKHVELILRSALPKSVNLKVQVPNRELLVNLDENRFEQVLVNLCINARDAISDTGGVIQILASASESAAGKQEVVVSVIDNGHGIPPELISKIFEPFFSTKGPGKGTGLGLAMVHGVVVQLGGTIRCHSQPGRGATFEMRLPMAENPSMFEAANIAAEAAEESVMNKRYQVLIVDDEPLVRMAGQSLIETMGYDVITASSGEEALALIESNQSIDAVLLDVTMPDMSGHETLQRIRTRWPDLPVALCSGLAQYPDGFQSNPDAPPFVKKPYAIASLRQSLAELVGRSQLCQTERRGRI